MQTWRGVCPTGVLRPPQDGQHDGDLHLRPLAAFASQKAEAVPKDKVIEVVNELHTLEIKAPIQIGQIILKNVANTGIAVIATRSLPLTLGKG